MQTRTLSLTLVVCELRDCIRRRRVFRAVCKPLHVRGLYCGVLFRVA